MGAVLISNAVMLLLHSKVLCYVHLDVHTY